MERAVLAAENVARAPAEYAEEFGWSISLASWSATFACLIAALSIFVMLPLGRSWLHRRSRRDALQLQFLIHGFFAVLLVCFALPGPIVSSMTIGFFQLPIEGLGWINDHTLAAPILCLQFRLVPMAVFAFLIFEQQWQDRVGDGWRMDKSKPWSARTKLYWKAMSMPTFTIWVLLFAIAFGDLSSYLQCLPPGVTPVSMRIFDLLHYGVRSSEAGLLFFLATAGAVIGWRLQKSLNK